MQLTARTPQRITLDALSDAVSRAPRDAAASVALGRAHAARGELNEAFACLDRATRLDATSPSYWFALARLQSKQRQFAAAIEAARTGLSLSPEDAEALVQLGEDCEQAGETSAAAEAYVRAIRHAPIKPGEGDRLYAVLVKGGYYGLCRLLVNGRTAEEAETEAIARAPASAPGHLIRLAVGAGLAWYGRYPEAIAYLTAVIEREPEHPLGLIGAAAVNGVIGDTETARRCYSTALSVDPQNAEVILASLAFMYRGGRVEQIRRRLRDPAVRFILTKHFRAGADGAPIWDGSPDLADRTMLIDVRGDLHEALLYAQLLPLLKSRGARVILQGIPRLLPLLRRLPGVDEAVAPFEPCRPYDFCSRLRHLVFLLPWTRDAMTDAAPRLTLDAAVRQQWRDQFDGRALNVGIAWRSCDARRHDAYTYHGAPLSAFEPLAAIPGIRCHALQLDELDTTALADGHTRAWLDRGVRDRIGDDLMQAAAAVQALDAVITVDAAIAHLAGALGTPAFVLLPYHPRACWQAGGASPHASHCAWYHSARLCLQERPGDWSSAIARGAADLRASMPSAFSTSHATGAAHEH